MSERFDWAGAYRRLEAARTALDADPTPEEAEAILAERARQLARPPRAEETDETRDVVRFQLCGEPFAVDAQCVLEALPFGAPTPVPGTPKHLLGVINHRGRVLPVFDLRGQLVPHGETHQPLTDAVAVSAGGMTFVLAAEAVQETSRERAQALKDALVTVLDLEALAADPRLRIDDE
jgi:purine-binding chemotaxis protein CheW